MTLHKDLQGNIHDDMDGTALAYLPDGCVEITSEEADAIRFAAIPPLTQEEIVRQYTDAIQKRLDDFARTRKYDSILSACTYATSTIPEFAAEGKYCVEARDATWIAADTMLTEVQSGLRPMPTLIEVIALMPDLTWPQ